VRKKVLGALDCEIWGSLLPHRADSMQLLQAPYKIILIFLILR
jgi:hypothetical protein